MANSPGGSFGPGRIGLDGKPRVSRGAAILDPHCGMPTLTLGRENLAPGIDEVGRCPWRPGDEVLRPMGCVIISHPAVSSDTLPELEGRPEQDPYDRHGDHHPPQREPNAGPLHGSLLPRPV